VLSEAEQRRLVDIETQLYTDDHAFVQQFDLGWERRWPGRRLIVAIVSAVALAFILITTHGIGGVVLLGVLSLLVVKYLACRYVSTKLPDHYQQHGDRID
jgi:Protein of unknown function (DUF3040)